MKLTKPETPPIAKQLTFKGVTLSVGTKIMLTETFNAVEPRLIRIICLGTSPQMRELCSCEWYEHCLWSVLFNDALDCLYCVGDG
jgi:hypothetical protein